VVSDQVHMYASPLPGPIDEEGAMIITVPGGGMMMDAAEAARIGGIVAEHLMQQPELILLRAENLRLKAELAMARAANTCSSGLLSKEVEDHG
jgi:hypothetical protein